MRRASPLRPATSSVTGTKRQPFALKRAMNASRNSGVTERCAFGAKAGGRSGRTWCSVTTKPAASRAAGSQRARLRSGKRAERKAKRGLTEHGRSGEPRQAAALSSRPSVSSLSPAKRTISALRAPRTSAAS